ncbi:hypothetical protein AYO46_00715 [Betaproteobacteria bacterium SCGC AG-212-J23]|nr:hypothetical protein AYO46_00715 [Betaproteobacteria bacterium SCGC AG-212-J23]
MKRLLIALLWAAPSWAGGPIAIPAEVPFAPDVKVSDAARGECDLQSFQSDQLKSALGASGFEVTQKAGLTEAAPGKVLLLEFSQGESTGHALDIFSSRTNYLLINGCLYESGKVTATFVDTRYSTGGFGGEFKKTCAILHRIEAVMAGDIAKWAASNPPIFALLGNGAGTKVELPPNTPPFCMMSGKLTPEMKAQWRQQRQQR